MTYVKCSSCSVTVHFRPIDVKEFNRRFVDGDEPVYCFNCFKKKEKFTDKQLEVQPNSRLAKCRKDEDLWE